MSALGHPRTFCGAIAMSALPPKATSEAFFRLAALGQKRTFRAFGSDRVEKEAKTRCVTEKMAAPRAKALPVAPIIWISGSGCRPCQHRFRAPTCCRCHKIQKFVPLELAFELRLPCDVSLCP